MVTETDQKKKFYTIQEVGSNYRWLQTEDNMKLYFRNEEINSERTNEGIKE